MKKVIEGFINTTVKTEEILDFCTDDNMNFCSHLVLGDIILKTPTKNSNKKIRITIEEVDNEN